MPNPSVALCRAKPMTRIVASPMAPVAALPPMARPSPKLCSPMPAAISRDRRRAADQPATPVLAAVSSPGNMAPGPKLLGRPRPAKPPFVIDQAQQAGANAEEEEGAVAEYRPDPRGPVVEVPEGCIQRLVRVHEHVPDEEQQNPDGDGVEELAKARPGRAQPAQGQPEQDGHTGDKAEEQGLGLTHLVQDSTESEGWDDEHAAALN